MREVEVQDVFAASVPESLYQGGEVTEKLKDRLTILAQKLVWQQWQLSQRPLVIRFEPIDWLVTRDPDEAEAFQPAHDCPACLAGADQARAFLAEHPDRWIVLGNLRYVEVWAE